LQHRGRSVEPIRSLVHAHHSRIQIEIAPAQAAQLASAQAGIDREHDQRPPAPLGGGYDGNNLVG